MIMLLIPSGTEIQMRTLDVMNYVGYIDWDGAADGKGKMKGCKVLGMGT